MENICPVCKRGHSVFYRNIAGYEYLRCAACSSLHIACNALEEIDRGKAVRRYDADYWREEDFSARERARGPSLARAGEAILYCRRPVKHFLDVGTGPGYLLDELAEKFPARRELFHGVELFPPIEHSSHPNYTKGDVGQLSMHFDAGVCIEVIEHLTPRMLDGLARSLAKVSEPGTLWLFNTGMPDYVLKEDPDYLDPLRRGHIVSYSLRGLTEIFEPYGLRVQGLPGKSFAFVAEYHPETAVGDFEDRIYHPLKENISLLQEAGLFHQAAFESARAYLYQSQSDARASWAMDLQRQLEQRQKELEDMRRRSFGSLLWAALRRKR